MSMLAASRPRIVLLVDNDKNFVDTNAAVLENLGYTVLKAFTEDEAIAILHNRWIHLVVFDTRLIDDRDEFDFSGIKLALKEAKIYPRIIYTAFQVETAQNLFEQFFGQLPPGISIHSKGNKGKPERTIGDIVEHAFALGEGDTPGHVGINFNHIIEYASGLSRLSLVDLLKSEPIDDETQLLWAKEIDDLFSKAFADCQRVIISAPFKGRSVSRVLIINRERNGRPLAPLIVKCGDRPTILKEDANYRRYVADDVPNWVAHIDGNRPIETLHFGLIKYRIVNGEVENTNTFAEFYQRYTIHNITKAIKHLFQEAIPAWYRVSEKGHGSLSRFYEDRLLLSSRTNLKEGASLWAEIHRAVLQVIANVPLPLKIEQDGSKLRWIMSDVTLEYPEPSSFLTRLHEQAPALFTGPYLACLCHGDLHADNILVDRESHTWLIDFEHTGVGPLLQDAVELESSIHFSLIQEDNLELLLQFEQLIASQVDLDQPLPPLPSDIAGKEHANLEKAYDVIKTIRSEVAKFPGAELHDYLLGLSYQALRVVQRESSTSLGDGRRRMVRQLQALFLGSICCQRLAEIAKAKQAASSTVPPAEQKLGKGFS